MVGVWHYYHPSRCKLVLSWAGRGHQDSPHHSASTNLIIIAVSSTATACNTTEFSNTISGTMCAYIPNSSGFCIHLPDIPRVHVHLLSITDVHLLNISGTHVYHLNNPETHVTLPNNPRIYAHHLSNPGTRVHPLNKANLWNSRPPTLLPWNLRASLKAKELLPT